MNPPSTPLPNPQPLRQFVQAVTEAVSAHQAEPALLATVRSHLATLVAHDNWLPDTLAQPHPQHYCQYLLHCDAQERFSVVSFVWGPGQQTPVHDHTVWGLIGMLRGQEVSQPFAVNGHGAMVPHGAATTLQPGDVEAVSPTLGDIHQVRNALADQVSVSIHVYGANIGAVKRWVYAPDGTRKPFVSGYSNPWLPNLWDRSKEGV